ncbi:unnamed protein product [Pleuronectes platessa]|uniref:Uncharacterized protein n=1 Tax=Pleuronectes platessa TaxID=8262 RepID=A0A9N7TK95_PLEPL|nr:unnamed protein product [Pleuronectes platessa]
MGASCFLRLGAYATLWRRFRGRGFPRQGEPGSPASVSSLLLPVRHLSDCISKGPPDHIQTLTQQCGRMLLLRQLKLPLLPLRGCAGELGLSQPGSPGLLFVQLRHLS